MAKYLKVDAESLVFIETKDQKLGAKFKTPDGRELRILPDSEKTEYFTGRVASNYLKHFDLELFSESADMSPNEAMSLKKAVSPEMFERLTSKMVGKSYAEKYVKRHGFTDAFVSFENHSIVDCAKV